MLVLCGLKKMDFIQINASCLIKSQLYPERVNVLCELLLT